MYMLSMKDSPYLLYGERKFHNLPENSVIACSNPWLNVYCRSLFAYELCTPYHVLFTGAAVMAA